MCTCTRSTGGSKITELRNFQSDFNPIDPYTDRKLMSRGVDGSIVNPLNACRRGDREGQRFGPDCVFEVIRKYNKSMVSFTLFSIFLRIFE